MKSNSFVNNLPFLNQCLLSVMSRDGMVVGTTSDTLRIEKYDQLCKIHLWVLGIVLFSTYFQHL